MNWPQATAKRPHGMVVNESEKLNVVGAEIVAALVACVTAEPGKTDAAKQMFKPRIDHRMSSAIAYEDEQPELFRLRLACSEYEQQDRLVLSRPQLPGTVHPSPFG